MKAKKTNVFGAINYFFTGIGEAINGCLRPEDMWYTVCVARR